jgi:uncharacterized protein YbaP (TraB family)
MGFLGRRGYVKKRIWLGLAAFLFIAGVLVACTSESGNSHQATASTPVESPIPSASEPSLSPSSNATVVKEPGSKGFLWKISGGKNPGYLAGTIHISRQEMYPLDPDLIKAIEESDFVALELDLTKVNQKQTLKLVNDQALLTDGTALKDHVSEGDYTKFEAIMKKSLLGAATKMFDQYEPWYAAMTLESLPAMKYMFSDGIDEYIAKQAHKDGKTIIELESMESQIGLFDSFSDELQKLYFHQTVENASKSAIGIKQLLDMWTLGNLKQLTTMHAQYEIEGKKSMGKLFDDYNNNLLVTRNEKMAKKIDDYLANGESGTYLIAVGSLHMVGEQGLVSLLEKKGYTIEYIE